MKIQWERCLNYDEDINIYINNQCMGWVTRVYDPLNDKWLYSCCGRYIGLQGEPATSALQAMRKVRAHAIAAYISNDRPSRRVSNGQGTNSQGTQDLE